MILFDEATHTYTTIHGRVLPSVTGIVSALLGTSFDHIPAYILRDKAQFGTNVHLAVELFNNTGIIRDDLTIHEKHCLDQWVEISGGVEPIKSEVLVHYHEVYAGTFDLIGRADGKLTLIDYKTSYMLDQEYVAWQLNLYRLAYESMTGDKLESLQVAWLPKGKAGKLIPVDLMDDETVLKGISDGLATLNDKAD